MLPSFITTPLILELFLLAGAFQQTTSGLAFTDSDCYELDAGCFSVYGYEYATGWVSLVVTMSMAMLK
jgi:hypothetical protein